MVRLVCDGDGQDTDGDDDDDDDSYNNDEDDISQGSSSILATASYPALRQPGGGEITGNEATGY